MREIQIMRENLYPTHHVKTPRQLTDSLFCHVSSISLSLLARRSKPIEHYLRVVAAVSLIWLEKMYHDRYQ